MVYLPDVAVVPVSRARAVSALLAFCLLATGNAPRLVRPPSGRAAPAAGLHSGAGVVMVAAQAAPTISLSCAPPALDDNPSPRICFSCAQGSTCTAYRYRVRHDINVAATLETTDTTATLDFLPLLPNLLTEPAEATSVSVSAWGVNDGVLGDEVVYSWALQVQFPSAAISEAPSDPSRHVNPLVTLGSDLEGATFEYQLDGAQWLPVHNAATVALSAAALPALFTQAPPRFSPSTTATFHLDAAADGVARFEYRLDAGADSGFAWVGASALATIEVEDLAPDAWHTVEVRTLDDDDAPAATTTTWTWFVDTTPPQVDAVLVGGGPQGGAPTLAQLQRAGELRLAVTSVDGADGAAAACATCSLVAKTWVAPVQAEPASWTAHAAAAGGAVTATLPHSWLVAPTAGATLEVRVKPVDAAGNEGDEVSLSVPLPSEHAATAPGSDEHLAASAALVGGGSTTRLGVDAVVAFSAPAATVGGAPVAGFRYRVVVLSGGGGGGDLAWEFTSAHAVNDGEAHALVSVASSVLVPSGASFRVDVVAVAADGSLSSAVGALQWSVDEVAAAPLALLDSPDDGEVTRHQVASFSFGRTGDSGDFVAPTSYEYCWSTPAGITAASLGNADAATACGSVAGSVPVWYPLGDTFSAGPLNEGEYAVVIRGVSADGVPGPGLGVEWDVLRLEDDASRSILQIFNLGEGEHTLGVRATSRYGVSGDASTTSYTWSVDLTPPDTNLATELSLVSDDNVTVSASATEVGCTFKWQLDGPRNFGSVASIAGTDVPVLSRTLGNPRLDLPREGDWHLTMWAVDAAGNPDPTPEERDFEVSLYPPDTEVVLLTAGERDAAGVVGVRDRELSVELRATDADVTFACDPIEDAVLSEDGPLAVDDDGAAVQAATVDFQLDAEDGDYTISCRATNAAGHTDSTPAVVRLFLDTVRPLVSVVETLPAQGSPTNETELRMRVTASDLTDTRIQVDVIEGADSGWAASGVDADGWATLSRGEDGEDSTVSVEVVAIDLAGNVADPPGAASWVVDTTAPSLEFVGDVPSYVNTDDLHAGVVLSEAWVAVSISSDFTPFPSQGVSAGDAEPSVTEWRPVDDELTGTAVYPSIPGIDGSYVLHFTPTDAAGNTGASVTSSDIVVDRTPPLLVVAALPRASTSVQWVSINGTVIDDTAVDISATLTLDGDEVTASMTVLSTSTVAGETGVELPLDEPPQDPLYNGNYVATLSATDAAGNVDAVEVAWALDRQPPRAKDPQPVLLGEACSVAACPSGGVVTSSDEVTFEFTCTDNSGECSIEFAARSELGGVDGEAGSCAATVIDQFSSFTHIGGGAAGTPVRTSVTDLVDGTFSIISRATDAAGNAHTSLWYEWSIDRRAPGAAEFSRVPEGGLSGLTADFEVQLVDDDSPGTMSLQYELDGTAWNQVEAQQTADPGVFATATVALSGLLGGSHVLRVRFVDQAGNVGPPSIHVWSAVTLVPEIVALAAPLPSVAYGNSTYHFVFEARDPQQGTPVRSGVDFVCVSLKNGQTEEGCGDSRVVFGDDCSSSTSSLCSVTVMAPTPGAYLLTMSAVNVVGGGGEVAVPWTYGDCELTEYGKLSATGVLTCHRCPAGASCATRGATISNVVAEASYWAPSGATDSDGLTFYRCPLPDACVGGNNNGSRSMCGTGYEGVLCGVCSEGYYLQFRRCERCPESGADAALFVTMFAVIALAVLAVLFHFRNVLPRAPVKVFMAFAQIVGAAGQVYDIPWPPAFDAFLGALRVALMEVLKLTRFSCAEQISFYDSLVFTLLGFKILFAAVVALLIAEKALRKRRQVKKALAARDHSGEPIDDDAAEALEEAQEDAASNIAMLGSAGFLCCVSSARRSTLSPSARAEMNLSWTYVLGNINWPHVVRVAFQLAVFLYPATSLAIARTFRCTLVEGEWWLVADMRLQCFTSEWFGYAAYAIIMGVLYSLGLPAWIAYYLWKRRSILTTPNQILAGTWRGAVPRLCCPLRTHTDRCRRSGLPVGQVRHPRLRVGDSRARAQ